MKTLQRILLTWVFVMLSSMITAPNAYAKDQAAVVIIATGDFYAVNTALKKRTLKRRSKVYVGEKLVTGKNSRAQVRFIDGAVLSLRPETEMKIHKYSYGKSKADEGSWMSLLKGGFRTITGAIGKKKYKVTTSMATIGIRGTHYEAVISNEQLYVALWDGGVTLTNSAGDVDLGLGADYNFGIVQSDSVEPQGQIDPPAAIVNETQPDIAPDLSKSTTDSETTVSSLVDPVMVPDLYPEMPTSGTGIYAANLASGIGSVSATGSTDSITRFELTANVNFADASMTGDLLVTTVSANGENTWDFTRASGYSGISGQFDGTNFTMTGTGDVGGFESATASVEGGFTGTNAENLVGNFVLTSTSGPAITETGTFEATKQ